MKPHPPKISVIIPYKDAPFELERLLGALKNQTLKPDEILIIDSSEKNTASYLARKAGAELLRLDPEAFNHGLTRTLAAKKACGDVLVFFTQDALPAHRRALEKLLEALLRSKRAAVYGRQVAFRAHGLLAFLHRLFNYPPRSREISAQDIPHLGLRAAFFSNSFSAYWKWALKEIGWFPEVPALEDQWAAAKLLLAGHRLAYTARAVVFHSHPFQPKKEFQRFVAAGVFYAQNPWLIEKFGSPQGEGKRYLSFIIKELKKRRALKLLPYFLGQQIIRLCGYRWGLWKAKS